jgi:CheY-like chemotaxis protein
MTPVAHVLVADDDPFVRAFVTRILESAGYLVTAVDDGTPALEALLSEDGDSFAALASDCRMIRVHGPDVLARLRSAGRDVPILLTSGSDPPSSIPELENDRRAAFLAKPYRPEELLRTVKALIGQGS